MLKIIWNKEDFDAVRSKLDLDYNLLLIDDPNEIPHGKVGIIVDEMNINELKPIIEMLELKRSQVILQTPKGFVQIDTSDIFFLEAYGDDIYVHTSKKTNQVVKQPLYQLEKILKPYNFVRIGKSYLVNIAKIRYIKTAFNAKLGLELVNGEHLLVSRSFVKEFKSALGIQKKED